MTTPWIVLIVIAGITSTGTALFLGAMFGVRGAARAAIESRAREETAGQQPGTGQDAPTPRPRVS